MTPVEPHVNGDRLWDDLQSLGEIGKGDRGISRLAFSPADMEGRRWLARRMSEADLQLHMDQAGNVIGELAPTSAGDRRHRAPIIIGSHTDTVPEGGMFDGALGVLGGLEVARVIRETGLDLRHPLSVISFANEEGSRIIPGTFGSRSYLGRVTEAEWSRVLPFLSEAGLGGDRAPEQSLLPGEGHCYLELHIEQGGVLDGAGEDIGVVTGIVWITSCTATFRGQANHAGTTPMGQRRDALLGAAELALRIPALVQEFGGQATVGTCGQMSVMPGGRNVIPGEVKMSIEVRDLDEDVAARVQTAVRQDAVRVAASRGLTPGLTEVSVSRGALMDGRLQELIQGAADGLGLSSRRMPSGAGHDAMNVAAVTPTGMIFVPSVGGISHSPDEWTTSEQCRAGAEVLLRAVLAADAAEFEC